MMVFFRFAADVWWLWVVILPVTLLVIYQQIQHPDQRRWAVLGVGLALVSACIAVSLIIVTVVDLDPAKPIIDRVADDVVPMMVAAMSIGLVLFWFRKSDRALYGIAEIGFGVMTAGYAAWSPDANILPRVLALGAAVYIVVRGLDNIDAGKQAGSWAGRWLSRNSYGIRFYRDENSPQDQPPKGS